MGWIYIIVNMVNWKVYIGKWQGKRVETRLDDYRYARSHNKHLNNAVTLYGVDNFCFGVLHENMPIEMLGYMERQEIAIFDCNECRSGWGYNKTDGDDLGMLGYRHTQEAREAIREKSHQRVEDGTHNLLGGETNRKRVEDGTHNLLGGEMQREKSRQRVEDGTHHFLDSEFQRETQRKRVEDGTHNLLGGETNRKRVEDGTHHLLRENNPRARPEYAQAKTFYFLCVEPMETDMTEKRKQLFAEYPDISKRIIYYWIRNWQSEVSTA